MMMGILAGKPLETKSYSITAGQETHFLSVTLTVFVILALFSFTTVSAGEEQVFGSTENAKIELSKEERAFLDAHPVIRIGTDATWAITQEADGELQGFDVDILHYINQTTGANIQLVAGQWADMVEKAEAHEIDGLAASAPLKEREAWFNFSNAYATPIPLVLARSDSDLEIHRLGDLKGKTAAVQRGIAFYKSLLEPFPGITIIEADSEVDAMTMVEDGVTDVALVSTTTYAITQKECLKPVKIAYAIEDRPLNVVYSIRKDFPELISIINKALASLPPGVESRLYQHWFGYTRVEDLYTDKKVALTAEEHAWIKAHPVIRFGTDYRWEPYIIKKADGTLEGFDVDLVKNINERSGTNIELVTGRWADMVEQAKKRKIDGLATSAASKQREVFFNFSEPYLSVFPVFMVAGNSTLEMTSIADLAGKSVAILKSNQFHSNLLAQYPSIHVIESPSETEAIKLTVEGKSAATVVATTLIEKHYKTFGKDIKIGYVALDNPLDIRYSIRKDWPELLSIINKVLASLSRETKARLYSRWLGPTLPAASEGKEDESIPLTVEEQAWIKAHPDIRLGVDPAWQPIEFIDNKDQHQGVSSDYVRILNRRLGLNMKMVPNLSWVQVTQAAPKRGVDVLPGVGKTFERERYLAYSTPYLYIDWVIVSSLDSPPISSLADLEGRLTAVGEGSASYERMQKNYPGIPLITRKTTLDALQSVIEGEARAAVVERSAATMLIQSYRMHSLKVDDYVFEKDVPIGFAVRNDWPELVQILNKGLASITDDDREMIEQKWLAVPITVGFTKKDILFIVFSVILIMGIFLMFFIIWNRRLKKEIGERISAQKERQQVEDALRSSEATIRNKLKAIMEPEGDIDRLELSDILDTETMQFMLDNFHRLTGMSGSIIDPSGKVIVAVGWQDICTKFHRSHLDTLANCIESDAVLTKNTPKGTVQGYHCKNNMRDTVTPLMVGGRHVGNVFLSQFFYDDDIVDVELFREQARRYSFDEKQYLAALDRVPRFSREAVDAGIRFYATLAETVSRLSFSAIQQSRMLTERQRTEEEQKERARRATIQRSAIVQIALDKENIAGNIDRSLERIAEIVCSTIGVARTGIWKISDDGAEMRCLTLYDSATRTHSSGIVHNPEAYPRYFAAFTSEGRIYAEDAQSDPRTSELAESYLIPLGITSVLDAGILIEGKLVGIVTLDHIGSKRKWHADEESFAGTIAALVAQLLVNNERKLTEEALRQETALFEALMDSAVEGYLVVDRNGKEILHNQRTAEIWNIPEPASGGPDDQAPEQPDMNATMDLEPLVVKLTHPIDHQNEYTQDEVQLADGKVIERYSAPIISKDREIFGRIWSFHDITERKRTEEELAKHRQNLEKLVAERTQELTKMIRLMSGREIRMAELKQKNQALEEQIKKLHESR